MKKLAAVKELVRMANDLDSKGLYKEADVIDSVLLKIAQTPAEYATTFGTPDYINSLGLGGEEKQEFMESFETGGPNFNIMWKDPAGYSYTIYPNAKDADRKGIIFAAGGPRKLTGLRIRPGGNNYRKALEIGIADLEGNPQSVEILKAIYDAAPPDRALTLKEIGTAPSATVMGRKPEADLESTLEGLRTSPPSRPLPPAPTSQDILRDVTRGLPPVVPPGSPRTPVK